MQPHSSSPVYSMSISESPLTSSHGVVGGSAGARPLSSTWQPTEEQPADGHDAYPFRNFWSPDGNISEVLFALPSRERADVLISSFFEHIDPLYPIISENIFRNRFEEFWALPANERWDIFLAHACRSEEAYGDTEATSIRPGSRCNSSSSLPVTYTLTIQRQRTLHPSPRRICRAAIELYAWARF